jgi:hypothetical protein
MDDGSTRQPADSTRPVDRSLRSMDGATGPVPVAGESQARLPAAESADGVDLTLIRWTLSLTPLARLELLQDWIDGLTELRRGRVPRQ